jgi:hypothetical protein
MVPNDVLEAVAEAEIGREIIRLVPHWYEAKCGPEEYSIPIGPYTTHFYNHTGLPPNLSELLAKIPPEPKHSRLTALRSMRVPRMSSWRVSLPNGFVCGRGNWSG